MPSAPSMTIVQEERDHIFLWEAWGRDFSPPDDFPRLQDALDTLDAMAPSELRGALQAFEIQQPEVARTKQEALVRHYGFHPEVLPYFDQHMQEEPHIAFGGWHAYRFADPQEFEEGFKQGAALFFRSLNAFSPPRAAMQ